VGRLPRLEAGLSPRAGRWPERVLVSSLLRPPDGGFTGATGRARMSVGGKSGRGAEREETSARPMNRRHEAGAGGSPTGGRGRFGSALAASPGTGTVNQGSLVM
jgi:hypothetical protein